MKRIAYKFTKTTIIFLVSGLIAAIVCLLLNILRFVRLIGDEIQVAKDYATTLLSMAIGLAGIIIIIPVIISSSYDITKDFLTIRMGFIKTKIKVTDCKRITLFRTSELLVLFYNQSDYVVINTDITLYDNFVSALKEVNSKIDYIIDSDTSKEDLPT